MFLYHQRLCLWIPQIIMSSMLISMIMALPDVIKIGGLFEPNDEQQELAFNKIIKIINSDESMLPMGKKLQPVIKRISPQDSFRAYKTVCDFLSDKDEGVGVAAIIAPKSWSNLGVSQSISDTFEVPLLQTHWAPRTKFHSHTINVFPDSRVLSTAFSQYMVEHSWKTFSLIFENNEGLIRHQEVLQVAANSNIKMKVTLRHVTPTEDLSKLMKDLNKANINHFVVDLPLYRVKELFAAAYKVKMMSIYQSYLLTSLDIQTVEWDEEYIGLPNITSFRLVDPANPHFAKFLRQWVVSEQMEGNYIPSKQPITTESTLLYDSILVLTKTLNNLDKARSITIRPIRCDGSYAWPDGSAIVNKIRWTPLEGTTGVVKIDKDTGIRSKFTLDVLKVTQNGVIKTAAWDSEKGFQEPETAPKIPDATQILRNKTLRVTIGYAKPYVMLKEDHESRVGVDKFEGFCVDLLHMLAEKFGFNFVIAQAKDKKYGDNKSGTWNGMIGELLRREADIAITDLSIIYSRENVVDFTMPFMNLGISILFKKPAKEPPPMFSFLKPLSLEVWFYMGTGYLGVSLFLFILARLSPYEWVNPHPCEEDNDVVENQFTLLNSFWFTMGSIMQQGSDILPRAISTRIVASSWWFFTLIMISSYTANLAAFLTAQRMSSPIESAEDLAKQTTIQYGCKEGGSTQTFFKESKYPIYQRMWSFMESTRPSVFTKSNEEGIERVKMGNYAYLMESSSIEYITERNCELMKIGANLDSKGYGIATPPGSIFRGPLSAGILDLQENQQLQILKDKWWKPPIRCPDDSGADSAEMGIRNVGGVFVVLGIGSCFAVVIVVMEFIWKAHKMLDREPIIVMFWRELKSTLTCRGSTRPAPKDDDEPSAEEMPMVNASKLEGYTFS